MYFLALYEVMINNRRFCITAFFGVTKLASLVTMKKAVRPKRRLFITTSYYMAATPQGQEATESVNLIG